ncbi:hypothetical protein EJ06DRAFT_531497 [Trichodelitschia bisporula]|uniref:Uncharacterized protein n=1 Tax=Trichodelitschia bisporula TaxID=703511 RepID=A0A6G1HT21_9PEZI|nr:hypothetical protein EJ06DRAFT_531497 [Trichodelitschia bisporula]
MSLACAAVSSWVSICDFHPLMLTYLFLVLICGTDDYQGLAWDRLEYRFISPSLTLVTSTLTYLTIRFRPCCIEDFEHLTLALDPSS